MAAKNKPNELYIERVYDAPVKAVWDAWTDPEKVAKWWGPRGFTLTTKKKDVRPGGTWEYTMHGPDGVDYPNRTLFHEVEKYSRLVYDHGANDTQPALFKVTVVFTETKGRTKMEMTMALATAEAAKETKKFVKKAGGDSTWDRLAEYLAKEDTGKEQLVVNRSFAAPIETLFEMWTKPESFALAGHEQVERTKPNRIVYKQRNRETDDQPTRLVTVTLTPEDETSTRVTLVTEILGDASAEQVAKFVSTKPALAHGLSDSFDTLEEILASR